MADVNWSHGTLVTPETPAEPTSLGEDESIGALLDAAEDIIAGAAPDILADLDEQHAREQRRGLGRFFRRKPKG